VTLDPSLHLGQLQDTWVSSNTSTQTFYTATDLRSGKYGGTGAIQRSLLQFDPGPIRGTNVQSATLALYNNQSASCDQSKVTRAYALAGSFDANTTYSNRPGVDSSVPFTTTTGSKAGPTCSTAGFLRWDVLGAAKKWAAGSPAYGVTVLAADENDTANWKRYASADNGDNRYVPSLAVTYNSFPIVPDGLSTSPGNRIGDVTYVPTTSPTLRGTGYDPDGGTVQLNFQIFDEAGTTRLFDAATGWIPTGTAGSVAPPSDLLRHGSSYQWRVRTYDGTDYSGWSGWQYFQVDTVAPPAPPAQLAGSNGSTYTFSWSSPSSDTNSYRYGLDGDNPPSSVGFGTSTNLTASDGAHVFHLTAVDRAGNVSAVTDVAFNQDVTTVVLPENETRTGRNTSLEGTSRSGWDTVTFEYGEGTDSGWQQIPSGADGHVRDRDGNRVTLPVAAVDNGSRSPRLTWDVAATLRAVDGATKVRVCFLDSGGRSCSPVPAAVMLDQRALGDSYATRELGPGRLSLLNGNYALTEDDVTDGSGTTSLAVTRTFNTRTPNLPDASGMFGPGWLGSLPTDSADADYVTLLDRTGTGNGVVVTTSDGSTIVFQRRPDGAFEPTGDDAASGLTLRKDTNNNTFRLSDLDANTTTFSSDGTSSSDPRYRVTNVEQPGSENVRYTYGDGRLVRATAAPPNGATCTDPASTDTFTPGCRALELVYEPGNSRVTKVQLVTHRPDGSLLRVDRSCYRYDSNGRLAAQYDPRYEGASTDTAPPTCESGESLVTRYTYTADGRLATITPPGLAAWTLAYTGDRLTSMARRHDTANGGQAETSRIEYDLPLSSDGDLRPDMRPSAVARWAQQDVPVTATAVYGPDDGTDPRDAELTYIDVEGHEVNTAAYARTWRISTTEYDQAGHVVRTLTAANRDLALNPGSAEGQKLGLPADTAEAAKWVDTRHLYDTDPATGKPGIDLLQTYGPYREVMLPDGRLERTRELTTYAYDSGNEAGHPTGAPLHLETRRTVGASLSPGTTPVNVTDLRVTTIEYAFEGDNVGFVLRKPMRITENAEGPERERRTTVMKYSRDNGLMTEKRMPGASAPNAVEPDAQKTRIVYFTGDPQSPDAQCRNPWWAKLPCRIEPVAQPSTSLAPPLPVRTFTYDYLLRPSTVTETVRNPDGSQRAQRTSTTVYDNNGWAPRVGSTSLQSSLGVPIPDVEVDYDPATGLQTQTRSAQTADNPAGTTSMGYDDFGRMTSYTDANGNTATTSYDGTTGQLRSRSNDRGTVSWTYDGNGDRRGMPTGMTVSGLAGEFTATYDGDGQLIGQSWPNGMTQTLTRDTERELVKLVDQVPGQQAAWLEHTVVPSVHSQWRSDNSTTGARNYAYDGLGRLTRSTDRNAPAVAGDDACTARAYTYDIDSNRLAKHQRASTTSTCPALDTGSTADRVQTLVYDPADRLLDQGSTPGLVYDDFGRITTLPAAGTSGGAGVRNTYWANDLIRGQDSTDPLAPRSLTWTLDPQLRPRTMTDTGSPDGNANKTHHYDDTSDSPSWIDESNVRLADGTPTAWTRYIEGFNGDLILTQTVDGTFTYQLVNLHGDVTAKIRAGTTSGPEEYFDADEFGNPQTATSNGTLDGRDPDRYGWLGGKQRSNQTAGGLIQMGVRLYAPALGRFLQVDPVDGGSDNAYEYCGADPIGCTDLDGQSAKTKALKKILKFIAKAGRGPGKKKWLSRHECGSSGSSLVG
jgi:RHS repeat-associated protein